MLVVVHLDRRVDAQQQRNFVYAAVGSTPKEFADFIAREQARWKEVVQKAHVKVD